MTSILPMPPPPFSPYDPFQPPLRRDILVDVRHIDNTHAAVVMIVYGTYTRELGSSRSVQYNSTLYL